MGHAVDQTLLSLVQQDVKELIKNYRKTEAEQLAVQGSLAQQRTEQTELQNTVTFLQDQQSLTTVQLKKQEEQLKEDEEILKKLISVEKIFHEEILSRVQGVEKRLGETNDKVKQLEEGSAKVEKYVAETHTKVEQLEQEFRSQKIKENNSG